jgi:hypothetical protein
VRMGHASSQAALRYQHATRDRDAAIAEALSALVEQAQTLPTAPSNGSSQQTSQPVGRSRRAPRRDGGVGRSADITQGELFAHEAVLTEPRGVTPTSPGDD